MTITIATTSSPTAGLLTSAGVGSGIDVDKLVTTLVAAKKAPQQNQITNGAALANTQLSALGQVSAALSALQSAMAPLSDGSALSARSVSVIDNTVFSAASSGNPVAGSYKIDVTQLAGSLKASSGAYASASAAVGTGTLTVAVGGQSMSLAIDASNNTLAGIRDAINQASDNPGVAATIVNGTDGAHLVLSGTHTGAANGFTVSSSGGDGGLAGLNYAAGAPDNGLSVINPAQDALFTIDGLAANSADNSIGSAIDGITLNLAKVGSSTLTVAADPGKASGALGNLVNTYNAFIGIYKNLTMYDVASEKAGALIGDSTLNSIKSTLSRIVGGSGNGISLASVGISLQVDGTLKLDPDQVNSALADGGKQLGKLFGGEAGLGAQLATPLNGWVGSTGVLANRVDSLAQRLKELANQQITLDSRTEDLTARYRAQFTGLDALLSKLNSTSSYLQQQFDALSNANKR